MGLKDFVDRLAGKKPAKQRGARGSRGARERRRDRDESTIQVPSPAGEGAWPAPGAQSTPPSMPGPPASPLRTPLPQAPAASAPPPSPARPAAPSPPPMTPSAAPPPPAAPAPVAKAASRSRGGSAEATQYVTVPGVTKGEVVGVLVGIDGDLKGEMFAVMDGDNKLGRAQECDVNLLDPKISREHAMIASEDGVLLILPLSDKNPVFLNDEMVDEGDQLSDGDKLRLGNPGSSSFRFRTIEGL